MAEEIKGFGILEINQATLSYLANRLAKVEGKLSKLEKGTEVEAEDLPYSDQDYYAPEPTTDDTDDIDDDQEGDDDVIPPGPRNVILGARPGRLTLKWKKNADKVTKEYLVTVCEADTPNSAVEFERVAHPKHKTELEIGEVSVDGTLTITAGTTYYVWVSTVTEDNKQSLPIASTPTSATALADGESIDTTDPIAATSVDLTLTAQKGGKKDLCEWEVTWVAGSDAGSGLSENIVEIYDVTNSVIELERSAGKNATSQKGKGLPIYTDEGVAIERKARVTVYDRYKNFAISDYSSTKTGIDTTGPVMNSVGVRVVTLTATAKKGNNLLKWSYTTGSREKDYAETVIHRNTVDDFDTATEITRKGARDKSHKDNDGLTNGQAYFYWLTGVDDSGNVSLDHTDSATCTFGDVDSIDTTAPSQPTNINLELIPGKGRSKDVYKYILDWDESTDAAGNLAGYEWEIKEENAVADEVIGTDTLNYTCIQDHKAKNTNKPITGAKYDNFWSQTGSSGVSWVLGTKYHDVNAAHGKVGKNKTQAKGRGLEIKNDSNDSISYIGRVRAYDRYQNYSLWSDETPPVSDVDTTPPAVPVGLALFQVGNTIHATVTANAEPDFKEYEWHISTVNGFTPSAGTLSKPTGPENGHTFPNVAVSTTYYVRALARDITGNPLTPVDGNYCAQVSITTNAPNITPSVPTDLVLASSEALFDSATRRFIARATLTWTASVHPNSGGIYYEGLIRKKNVETDWTRFDSMTTSVTLQIDPSDADPNDPETIVYEVKIRAWDPITYTFSAFTSTLEFNSPAPAVTPPVMEKFVIVPQIGAFWISIGFPDEWQYDKQLKGAVLYASSQPGFTPSESNRIATILKSGNGTAWPWKPPSATETTYYFRLYTITYGLILSTTYLERSASLSYSVPTTPTPSDSGKTLGQLQVKPGNAAYVLGGFESHLNMTYTGLTGVTLSTEIDDVAAGKAAVKAEVTTADAVGEYVHVQDYQTLDSYGRHLEEDDTFYYASSDGDDVPEIPVIRIFRFLKSDPSQFDVLEIGQVNAYVASIYKFNEKLYVLSLMGAGSSFPQVAYPMVTEIDSDFVTFRTKVITNGTANVAGLSTPLTIQMAGHRDYLYFCYPTGDPASGLLVKLSLIDFSTVVTLDLGTAFTVGTGAVIYSGSLYLTSFAVAKKVTLYPFDVAATLALSISGEAFSCYYSRLTCNSSYLFTMATGATSGWGALRIALSNFSTMAFKTAPANWAALPQGAGVKVNSTHLYATGGNSTDGGGILRLLLSDFDTWAEKHLANNNYAGLVLNATYAVTVDFFAGPFTLNRVALSDFSTTTTYQVGFRNLSRVNHLRFFFWTSRFWDDDDATGLVSVCMGEAALTEQVRNFLNLSYMGVNQRKKNAWQEFVWDIRAIPTTSRDRIRLFGFKINAFPEAFTFMMDPVEAIDEIALYMQGADGPLRIATEYDMDIVNRMGPYKLAFFDQFHENTDARWAQSNGQGASNAMEFGAADSEKITVKLTTGTTTGDRLTMARVLTPIWFYPGKQIGDKIYNNVICEWGFKLLETTTLRFALGLTATTLTDFSTLPTADSILFHVAGGGTNFQLRSYNGGEEATDSGVAIDTSYHTVKILWSLTEVRWYLDDVLITTHTTRAPTGTPLKPFIHIETRTTATRSVRANFAYLDYLE